ncbi:hypothetical protein AAMO2058_000559600 [Amorphochlora amoebiformis]
MASERTGYLWAREGTAWQHRYFTVAAGWLFASVADEESILYKVNLEHSHTESLPITKNSGRRYSFTLHAPNSKKILTLACDNKEDFEGWIQALITNRMSENTYNSVGSEEPDPVTPAGQSGFAKWLEETKNTSKNKMKTYTITRSESNTTGYVVHTYYGTDKPKESAEDLRHHEERPNSEHVSELEPLLSVLSMFVWNIKLCVYLYTCV